MGAPAMGVVRWASCDAVRRLRLAEIVVVIRYQDFDADGGAQPGGGCA